MSGLMMTCWREAFVSLIDSDFLLFMYFRQLWCNGKRKNDNNFWNAARFKSFSRVRVYALANHKLNLKSPCMWRWNKLNIPCSLTVFAALVVYLGCWSLQGQILWKYFPGFQKQTSLSVFIISKHSVAEEEASSALCNCNKKKLWEKTSSGVGFISCLLCNPGWYALGVLLLTNCSTECRQHTVITRSKWFCSCKRYTCRKQTCGLRWHAFQGLVIITNLD